MDETAPSTTINYRIHHEAAGWRLDRGSARLGLFADPAEAVAQACRAAKADAARGRVAIVSAQTAPQELHCYVPPGDAGAQACGLSRNPRLAANL